MINKYLLIFIAVCLSGCSTKLSYQASLIQDADLHQISNCKYLGDVDGTSGFGNLAASTGINNAKNEAREKAANINATHIIWTTVSGGYSPFVSGKAYQCIK